MRLLDLLPALNMLLFVVIRKEVPLLDVFIEDFYILRLLNRLIKLPGELW